MSFGEKMMRKLILGAAFIAAPATAQPAFQDLSLIDGAVTSFTGKPIGSEGGARAPVDTRLKLAPCPMVALSWRTPAHDAVVVACAAPEWRVFVPVLMPPAAPAAATAQAVAAKPEIVIKRGDPVTIEAGAAGFSVTREGVAMSEAPAGGRFLVNVDGARKPIQAIAIETGRATLPGYTQ